MLLNVAELHKIIKIAETHNTNIISIDLDPNDQLTVLIGLPLLGIKFKLGEVWLQSEQTK